VSNFSIDKKKRFGVEDQKAAILARKDLTVPLRADFHLRDKASGELVDYKKNLIVAHIPYITDRNTAIYNGSEYISVNQQRLKPGIYTRIRDTGEAEAHVNVAPGTGLGGKVLFLPDKALFVYQLGSTQIKLYGLLIALGVSDSEIKKSWGPEVYLKNKQAYTGDEVDKFYNKVFSR